MCMKQTHNGEVKFIFHHVWYTKLLDEISMKINKGYTSKAQGNLIGLHLGHCIPCITRSSTHLYRIFKTVNLITWLCFCENRKNPNRKILLSQNLRSNHSVNYLSPTYPNQILSSVWWLCNIIKHTDICRVFQKELYNDVSNVAV
jgi:hypothetical protein